MTTPLPDENGLKKIWLKQKFSSWEYHEELLALHDKYLSTLHRHWEKPEIQEKFPEDYAAMRSPIFLNLDRVQKPGEISKAEWKSKPTVGWADAISYNFNRGMDFAGANEYAGMPDSERLYLNSLVGQMLNHCQNIKTMVTTGFVSRRSGTDDIILNEEITGPISWPTDWKADVLGVGGASLAGTDGLRAKAGDPVPQDGLWRALDISGRELRLRVGESLPDLHSAYGLTIWQRIGD